MTVFTQRNLNQKAVYWGSPTPDNYGTFTFDDPVEIYCRWESSTKVIRVGNTVSQTTLTGEQIVCKAEVQINLDLDEQGMLYLGELDDLTVAEKADPSTISTAYIIQRVDKIPTIKGSKFFRKAFL